MGGIAPIEAQRLEALGRLAPGVALEFGNLMTVVLGSMEQLRRQPLDEQGREQLQRAESGARQTTRLIRQALSFSLPRHEGSTHAPVDLDEAVRRIDADSVDPDQPIRPIVITCPGDQNHAVHRARGVHGGRPRVAPGRCH